MVRQRQVMHEGRNYVEALIMTLTSIEFANPRLEVREGIVRRLEQEVVALGLGFPAILNEYKRRVEELIRREYPKLPPPDLSTTTMVYDTVLEWMMDHAEDIIGKPLDYVHKVDVERQVKEKCIHIVRIALFSTLYSSGLVRVK